MLLVAMANAVDARCITHGLSKSGAALNLNLLMHGSFELSCELVQLLCCALVMSLKIKSLKLGNVVLDTSGLREAVLGCFHQLL